MIIPKPGEFFVVSTDQVPSLNRKLMSQAMRESTEKAMRDASPGPTSMGAKSRQLQTLALSERGKRNGKNSSTTAAKANTMFG